MRKLLVAAMAAAVVLPATGLSATSAAAVESAPRPVAATSAAPTLSMMRTAAFATANRMAVAAPRLSLNQKSRNATTLAKMMRLPNITVRERGVAIAKTQLGTYYRWGGATPAGFDCSGLTSFAYAKAGKALPRTAEAQRQALPRTSTPRIGDLVFIGAPAYHVGIYVGNGKMLHAPRTGKPVQIAKIWTAASYGRVG